MAGNKYNVTFDPRPKTWRELFFLTDEERAELEKQRQFDMQAQQDAINSMNPEAQARSELAREDQQIAWAREDQLNDERLAEEAIAAQRRADAEYLRTGHLPNNPIDAQRLAPSNGQVRSVTTEVPQDAGPILAVPNANPRGVGPLRLDENGNPGLLAPPISESRNLSDRPVVGVATDPTTTNSTTVNSVPVTEQAPPPTSGPVLKTDDPQKKGIADTVWGWLGVTDPEERKEIAWSMLSGAGANIAAAAEGYNGWGAFGKGLEATGKARGENLQNLTDRAKTTAAIEAHKLKNAADARAQAYQQRMAQIIADGRGRGDAGLTAEQLFELAAVATAGGDMETARKAMEYGQQLQQAIAKDGQYIDQNGVVQNAPGSVAANAELEAGKSAGRKAGEAPFESTSDLRELDRANSERAAKGLPPISTEDWIRQSQTRKQTNISVNSNAKDGAMWSALDAEREKAAGAQGALLHVYQMKDSLPNATTGFGANQILAAQKVIAALGGDSTKVTNTETFKIQAMEMAARMKGELVGNAQISNSDMLFVQQVAGGDITLDQGTLERLLDIREKSLTHTINRYNERIDSIYPDTEDNKLNRTYFGGISIPERPTTKRPPTSVMYPSGQAITNQNGRIYVKRQ